MSSWLRRREILAAIGGFLGGLPIAVVALDCLGYIAVVEGASMQPTLNPDMDSCDFVFLNRWSTRNFQLQRGEIVSFTSPTYPDRNLIKRIIGLEGDLVRTRSNSKPFVKIPEGHCWVEGDCQRKDSLDSNRFGPVSVGLIRAKATHIVWPPERWQRLIPQLSDRKPVRQDIVAWFSDDEDY